MILEDVSIRKDLEQVSLNVIKVLTERAGKAEDELAKAKDYIEAQDREIMLRKERLGEFLHDIVDLRKAFSAAKAFIDAHVCDHDITAGMLRAWGEYQQALKVIGGDDGV